MHHKRIGFMQALVSAVETCRVAMKRYWREAVMRQHATDNGNPKISRIEYEASQWIARLNADDVSVDDGARFEAWRSSDPRHAQAYEELTATWRDLNVFKKGGRDEEESQGGWLDDDMAPIEH
jgi:hypothetical protein